MEIDKTFLLFAISSGAFLLSVLVHAQDQSGFISIDCGVKDGSSYRDNITGIKYVSDAPYIYTGVSGSISSEINTTNIDKQYLNLRSFPEGTKSCYTLNATQGKYSKYLIRAGFLYGNYDKKGQVPRFDLYLGVNWWKTVTLYDPSSLFVTEIMHVAPSSHVEICLVNTGFGTPFISVLELRPLNNDTYVTESGALETFKRFDCGLTSDTQIRYPEDVCDRIWSPHVDNNYWQNLRASSTVKSLAYNNYRLPSIVMETAVTPINDSYFVEYWWTRDNPTSQFYIYLHFAEFQELKMNQSREFNIYMTVDDNEELWGGPFSFKYLQTNTISKTTPENGTSLQFTINKTRKSTFQPLLNAFEIYLVKDLLQSETYQEDVEAIMNINSTYGLKRYWHGDPCEPMISIWDGLNCSYDGHNPPRIISLDLSSSGLTGQITPYISNLKMLHYLDLSNNSLTGPVPDFLSQLQFLRVLNLSNNKLSGSVPVVLTERSKNGILILNASKNRKLCSSDSCKDKVIVPVVATICAFFVVLLAAAVVFWSLKRRKQAKRNQQHGVSKLKERSFAYSDILTICNNLENVLGNGNCGTVYHGYLYDSQVAIKIFSPLYAKGYKKFQAEAKLLTRIHHRNLTTCFGYCDEDTNKGLIYEYMANGNLEDTLSDRNANCLSWQERLQIAMDVAQGLEYLHKGCNPPIIHGNLKPTNVLFNENFEAKLVDFGLSKIFTAESVSTQYIDPEYYVTNKLIERNDVYSFGVILLRTITSQPIITNNPEKTDIIQWVRSLLGKGDIRSIVDSRLKGDFHIDSVWKAVELAMTCVCLPSINRPSMTHVVKELNQCLAMEIARINRSEGTIELVSVNLTAGLSPLPR